MQQKKIEFSEGDIFKCILKFLQREGPKGSLRCFPTMETGNCICSYKCNSSSIHPLTTQHPTLVVKLCFKYCTLGLGLARYLFDLDWPDICWSLFLLCLGWSAHNQARPVSIWWMVEMSSLAKRVNKPLKPPTILQSTSSIFCKVTQIPYKKWTICSAQQGCPPPPFEGFYRGE